jgi:muramoyltetrapeptide carboxypeptidase LdcA involved in peptidoglycan recycling
MPLAAQFPDRMRRSLEGLARCLDVKLRVPEQVWLATGFTAGDACQRAQAFNALLADPEVRAIVCTIGGYNSADILPLVDYERAARDPKILLGFSDCTSLLIALATRAGWHTFHGPTLMTQFGEYPEPLGYTVDALRRVLMHGAGAFELEDPPAWTNEFLDWRGEEWLRRPRALQGGAQREVWRAGQGEGRLFGGNFETLNFVLGTPYGELPDALVLFWEATGDEAALPRIQRSLAQLAQLGVLSRTRAMLVGRCPDARPQWGTDLREVVLEATREFEFPIVANLAFGHTDPMFTLPIGVPARVDATAETARIRLCAAAVRGER